MDARTLWGATLLLGALLVVTTNIAFGFLPSGPPDVARGYGGTIYAVEFAPMMGDVRAALGWVPDAPDPEVVRQLTRGLLFDFAYLLHYSLFMALFCLAALRSGGPGWLRIGIALAVLAGAMDAVENHLLLEAVAKIDAVTATEPIYAALFARVKFAAIAGTLGVAGLYMLRLCGALRWLGGAALLAALAVVPGILFPSRLGFVLGNAIGVGWLAMLVCAFQQWRTLRAPRGLPA